MSVGLGKRAARLHFKHGGPIKAGETFTVEATAKTLFRGYSKMDIDPTDLWVVAMKIGDRSQRPMNIPPKKAEQFTSILMAGSCLYDSVGPPGPRWSITFRTDRDLESFRCVMHGDTYASVSEVAPIDVTNYEAAG